MRYHFRVVRALPGLGLEPGDLVSYDPADAEPFLLHRHIRPDVGALLAAMNDGALDGSIPPQLVAARPSRSAAPRVLRLLPRDSRSTG